MSPFQPVQWEEQWNESPHGNTHNTIPCPLIFELPLGSGGPQWGMRRVRFHRRPISGLHLLWQRDLSSRVEKDSRKVDAS